MALVNKAFSVSVTPGAMPPIVHVSEYDVGRAYTVSILDEQGNTFTIPTGTTASIEGTLNGSVGFTQSATISNNQVSFTLSESMTAYSGKAWCKIKLTQNSQPIQTCAFVLAVDRAGVEADTVIGAPGFEEQIADAAAEWMEQQGFTSPTVSTTQITGGNRVTFTDKNGSHSIDVMDGEDGGGFELPSGGQAGQALISDGEGGAEWGESQSDSVILTSPNGTKWMIAVTNSGEIISQRAPYTITRTLNNCVGKTVVQDYEEGTALLEVYEADDFYTLDGASVSVTMGGVNVTSTVYNDRVVTIPNVTGDIVITVNAVPITYHTATAEELTLQLHEGKLLLKAYTGTYENVKLPTSITYNGTTYTLENNKLGMYDFNFSGIVHFGSYGEIPVWNNANSFPLPTAATIKSISPNPTNGRSRYLTNLQKLFKGSLAGSTWTAGDNNNWKGNAAFKTALGVVYPEAQTSLAWLYWNCTELIDGGTIPSWVTNVQNMFYGCTSLKHVRIEAKNTTDVSRWLYDVPASCVVELYTDSNLFTSLKNALSAYEHRYKGIDEEIKRIYCVGDSITYGSGATTPSTERYPVVLSQSLTQAALVGMGAQGGYTMKQILDTFITPYPQRCKEDIVIMMAGTNGAGESGKTKIQMWAEMVAALDGNPHYIIIPDTTSGYDAAIESELASIYGDNFLSVHDWFIDNGYTMSNYLYDGTHFNTAGYALLAQCVKEKLNALGWLD